MTVYVIGATSLTGGGTGALDAEYVDANGTTPWSGAGETPGIHDGDPALVFVQNDAIYHYIADATSGAAESSPDVIKPDWLSSGVAYTGDLRWILHAIKPATSLDDGTNTGDIVRWNAVSEAWESSAEPFDFTQINLTPQAAAVENVEGGMYYKSSDKTVYICTSDT